MSEPLSYLEPLIAHNCGARFEGEVFSVLKQSRHVVRSFEFGAADGVVDCSAEFDSGLTFSQRFQHLRQQEPTQRRLLLFDVKSTTGLQAGRQRLVSFPSQKATVAFYIAICAVDQAYVEVLPNYDQDAATLESGQFTAPPDSEAAERTNINISRSSWLPPATYGYLDPCSNPYRMPRWMLPEAIARIRRCVLEGKTYVNPWSGVKFPEWRPLTTPHITWAEPAEDSSQYTAYEQVMLIMRAVNHKSRMEFDFLGLQPRLGDFKLDDYYIQHKVATEPKPSSEPSSFRAIQISRDKDDKRHFFFHAFERFDFFMYQFEFAGTPQRRGFFFIPESEFDDRFYTTQDRLESFEAFYEKFFIHMDEDLRWVGEMESIIAKYPQPRRPSMRPAREAEMVEPQDGSDPGLTGEREGRTKVPGRQEYSEMMRRGLRQFYQGIMFECALRGRGLLVVLSKKHGAGDVGFCRYVWTPEERQEFLEKQQPPQYAHTLPARMVCVPICCFVRERECSFQGPSITASQFRRLNAFDGLRLLVFDIGGRDALGQPLPPAIIPSGDVALTENQRQVLAGNLGKKKAAGEWERKTPNISGILTTGLMAAEYAPQTTGPVQYGAGERHYASAWETLSSFSSPHPMQHPPGHEREPYTYCHTLQSLNQHLKDQHVAARGVRDVV